MTRTIRTTRLAAMLLLPFLVSCGDADGPRVDPDCVERVTRMPGEGTIFSGAMLQVRAVNAAACAPLNGPLIAFNYFSYADQSRYDAYGAQVSQILFARGHKLFLSSTRTETLEIPPGTPAMGGAYEHEVAAAPLYTSAGDFMDMLLSPEFQAIAPLQQGGSRQEDYIFGFQDCHVGCPTDLPAFNPPSGPLLLHIFGWNGGDLGDAIQDLASDDEAPELFYGGELVGRFELLVGDRNLNSQNPPWGEGTVIYRVASTEAAREWIASERFRRFRENTDTDGLFILNGDL